MGQARQGLTRADACGSRARAPPRAACIESQAVKTTERGGPERGEEGGKTIKGRKRPLWGDTLGWFLVVLRTRAGREDGVAAPILLGHVTPQALARLVTSLADPQDHHHALDAWRAEPRAGGHSAVTRRPAGTTGFTPLAKRWVMERTNAGQGRYRRNSKDDERRIESSTALRQISHIHLRLPAALPAVPRVSLPQGGCLISWQ
jgi:putative transposase